MSETNTIKGTVETVLDLQEFASGFCKRVLVINTGGDYPQTIPVEFVKDKVEILTGLRKGQEVEAFVNLRGKNTTANTMPTFKAGNWTRGNLHQAKNQHRATQSTKRAGMSSTRRHQRGEGMTVKRSRFASLNTE